MQIQSTLKVGSEDEEQKSENLPTGTKALAMKYEKRGIKSMQRGMGGILQARRYERAPPKNG